MALDHSDSEIGNQQPPYGLHLIKRLKNQNVLYLMQPFNTHFKL